MTDRPNRRRFLGGLAFVGGLGLAGCSGSGGSDEEADSDDDGVPDDEDYAPRDDDVQDESDVRVLTDGETSTAANDDGGSQPENEGGGSSSGSSGNDDGSGFGDVSDSSGSEELQAEAERKVAEAGGAISSDYRLVVTESEFYREEYTEGVRGVVENISDVEFDYVEVNVGFYDDTDAKLADGLANTSGLDPGGRWRFDATYFGTNAEALSYYRIDELSGSSY